MRLAGATGATADGAGEPRMDDVLALNVLLHVAELLRGVVAVGAAQLGRAGMSQHLRLNASHNLRQVLNELYK